MGIQDLEDSFADTFHSLAAVAVAHYHVPFGEVGLGGDGAVAG